jgi:hypothetical protein
MTRAAPQLVTTASLNLIVTAPQPSTAVAAPVTFVLVSVAGHSSTTSAGQVITGGVVSTTVIVCTQLALLPQASDAVQVRRITLVLPQRFVTESTKPIVVSPQPSRAVATPVELVLVSPGHSIVTFVGQIMLGGVVSRTVMVCTQLAEFPHPSIAVQVRAMIFVPPQLLVTESL